MSNSKSKRNDHFIDFSVDLLGKKRKAEKKDNDNASEKKKHKKTFKIMRKEGTSDNEDDLLIIPPYNPSDINEGNSLSQLKINHQLKEDNDADIIIPSVSHVKKSKKKKSLFDQDMIKFPSVIEINTLNKIDKEKKANKSTIMEMQLNETTFFPWIMPNSPVNQQRGMLKLHYEILDFYEFIKPTEEERLQREKTFLYIKSTILNQWPNWKVKKFGSYPTNLNLPDSDIDLVLLPDKKVNDIQKLLKKISDTLIFEDKFSYLEVIRARVPIIKATFKETGINVDISVDRKNGYAAKGIIKKVLIEFPYMRPLLYLLKYFLRQKNLNSSFTGGISSFVLFNLVYSYILYLKKNFRESSSSEMTLGHMLVGFFQFYGFDFNYDKVGMSIRYGGFFYKRDEQGGGRKSLLSMENFQDLDQDLGRNCFKFIKVIDAFKIARDALYYPSIEPIKSYLGLFLFVDDLMKERYDRLFKNK